MNIDFWVSYFLLRETHLQLTHTIELTSKNTNSKIEKFAGYQITRVNIVNEIRAHLVHCVLMLTSHEQLFMHIYIVS